MSNHIDHFSDETIKAIGYYVYRLIDPRNGQTFYVGKGKGNRVFEHVRGALKVSGEEKQTAKISQINEIHNAGLEVIHVIQRWGMTEEQALLVESALIDCFPGLTNIQSGHHKDYGVCNAEQLEKRFAAKEYVEPDGFGYLIFKITEETLEKRDNDFYEASRYAWNVNIKRAKSCKYVFAVLNGIVKEVFEPERWEEYPDEPSRYSFEGKKASDDIRDRFVDKRLPEKYKRVRSPVLYSKNEVK